MSQATQGAAATGNPPEKTHRGIVKLVSVEELLLFLVNLLVPNTIGMMEMKLYITMVE